LTLPYYKLKIIMGLIPIGINALCVIPVALRKKASDRSDEPVMKRNTNWIFAAFYSGFAAALVASIPDNVRQAAQSIEWAPAVLFYCLLDAVTETREQQLLRIARHMGADSEGQVRALLKTGDAPSAAQRLPLLELAFPALKRRPAEFVTRVLATVQELVQVDSHVDVFEYLLARLITQHLWESQNPHRARLSGSSPLTSCLPQVSRVLAILAMHGNDGAAEAELAYQAGMARLVVGMWLACQ
jgi:hypothetical protein